jgi:hypothetical protein
MMAYDLSESVNVVLYNNVRYDQPAKLGSTDLAFPSAKAKEAPREHTTLPAVALFSSQFLSMLSPLGCLRQRPIRRQVRRLRQIATRRTPRA